jgi:hypothetical protein
MGRAWQVKLFVFVWGFAVVLFASAAARAETWQAPVGGKAIALPEGRLACPGTSGDWSIE